MTRYAVLGGGVAGLVVALRLAQAGEAVVVYEKETDAGGLAAGFRVGDAWLEKFYHHLFRTDTAIRRLIAEAGLEPDLVWESPATAMWVNGREALLNSPQSLLRFPELPVADRVRMGMALAYLKALPHPGRLEGQTATEWLRRWMGTRAYELIWRPQQEAKFGALADEIAAPWFWARIHDRTTSLGYLRGGFQRLYEWLVEGIRGAGGTVLLGTAVHRVTGREGAFSVEAAGDAGGAFDRVISTLPPRLTAQVMPEIPQSWTEQLAQERAYGAHCLILDLAEPLIDAYWLSVLDRGFPFMAVVEHTNWMPAADYGGRRLVYIGNYRAMDDPLYQASADDLVTQWTPWLQRINPRFDPAMIRQTWMFAAPFAQPIVTRGYRDRIPSQVLPIQGAWLASMFQVYPHDRGQNYSVELAEGLAAHLLRGEPLVAPGRA